MVAWVSRSCVAPAYKRGSVLRLEELVRQGDGKIQSLVIVSWRMTHALLRELKPPIHLVPDCHM